MPVQNTKQNKIKKFMGLFNPSTMRGGMALFALVFAIGGGGYLLYKSFAMTGPTSITYSDYNRLSGGSKNVKIVQDYFDNGVNGKVMQISPGGELLFDPPGPTFAIEAKTCYVMRNVDDYLGQGNNATIDIGSYGATKRLTLQPTNYYREFCLTGTSTGGFTTNVKYISGNAKVNVKHKSSYRFISTDYIIVNHGSQWSCDNFTYAMKCTGSLVIQLPNKPNTQKTISIDSSTYITGNGTSLEKLRTAQFPIIANITIDGNRAAMIEVW